MDLGNLARIRLGRLVIGLVEGEIVTLLLHELVVGANLHHLSCIDHSNGVRTLDGGEAMGNDYARPASLCLLQCLLHHLCVCGSIL